MATSDIPPIEWTGAPPPLTPPRGIPGGLTLSRTPAAAIDELPAPRWIAEGVRYDEQDLGDGLHGMTMTAADDPSEARHHLRRQREDVDERRATQGHHRPNLREQRGDINWGDHITIDDQRR